MTFLLDIHYDTFNYYDNLIYHLKCLIKQKSIKGKKN